MGIITHELLHNMGMLHTHTRLDRGEHVHVNYLNVLPDKWIDYSWNPLQFPLDTEYDCDSIMHYRDTSFNIGNSITLEVLWAFSFISLLLILIVTTRQSFISLLIPSLLTFRQWIHPDAVFAVVQIDRPALTLILSTNFTTADILYHPQSMVLYKIQGRFRESIQPHISLLPL